MKGGDEIFIGQKYTGNEATLLFRNEAKPLVPCVPHLMIAARGSINEHPFF